jgi:hypothetical protein
MKLPLQEQRLPDLADITTRIRSKLNKKADLRRAIAHDSLFQLHDPPFYRVVAKVSKRSLLLCMTSKFVLFLFLLICR